MRKKVFILILTVCTICLTFTGCSMTEYSKAENLFRDANYAEAADIYKTLGDYKDSLEKYKESVYMNALSLANEKNYGEAQELFESISDYKDAAGKAVDYGFMYNLEQSVTRRMEQTSKESTDYATLVSTELAYVEEYKNADFTDENLKYSAKRYIDGLLQQKESLKKDTKSDRQLAWYEGRLKRYEVLNDLYEDYGFMEDNADFKGQYIAQMDQVKRYIEGMRAIEKDIDKQIQNLDEIMDLNSDYACITLKNNTEYTFTTYFDFKVSEATEMKEEAKILAYTTTTAVENIKPHTTYQTGVYIDVDTAYYAVYWENYYGDIS